MSLILTSSQLAAAHVADLALGDPLWLPHPVQLFGIAISAMEKLARRVANSPNALRIAGMLATICITAAVGLGTSLLLNAAGRHGPIAAWVCAVYLAFTSLSMRSLDNAAKQVIEQLKRGNLEDARAALAMIVGRDTAHLDQRETIRAVIETVAENTSDGVVAPMFYLVIGGVPAALTYKAINTLDSMIGYKNAHYVHFGWAAARLDDLVNLIPARLTALLVAIAAGLLGMPFINCLRIVRRDARLQPSPNSGFPEAAYAGALSVRLGGMNFYGGESSPKAGLGDARRELSPNLYSQARVLLYMTSTLMLLLSFAVLAAMQRGSIWR